MTEKRMSLRGTKRSEVTKQSRLLLWGGEKTLLNTPPCSPCHPEASLRRISSLKERLLQSWTANALLRNDGVGTLKEGLPRLNLRRWKDPPQYSTQKTLTTRLLQSWTANALLRNDKKKQKTRLRLTSSRKRVRNDNLLCHRELNKPKPRAEGVAGGDLAFPFVCHPEASLRRISSLKKRLLQSWTANALLRNDKKKQKTLPLDFVREKISQWRGGWRP